MIAKVNQSFCILPKKSYEVQQLGKKRVVVGFHLFSAAISAICRAPLANAEDAPIADATLWNRPRGAICCWRCSVKNSIDISRHTQIKDAKIHRYTDTFGKLLENNAHFARRRIKISAIIKIAHADIVFGSIVSALFRGLFQPIPPLLSLLLPLLFSFSPPVQLLSDEYNELWPDDASMQPGALL